MGRIRVWDGKLISKEDPFPITPRERCNEVARIIDQIIVSMSDEKCYYHKDGKESGEKVNFTSEGGAEVPDFLTMFHEDIIAMFMAQESGLEPIKHGVEKMGLFFSSAKASLGQCEKFLDGYKVKHKTYKDIVNNLMAVFLKREASGESFRWPSMKDIVNQCFNEEGLSAQDKAVAALLHFAFIPLAILQPSVKRGVKLVQCAINIIWIVIKALGDLVGLFQIPALTNKLADVFNRFLPESLAHKANDFLLGNVAEGAAKNFDDLRKDFHAFYSETSFVVVAGLLEVVLCIASCSHHAVQGLYLAGSSLNDTRSPVVNA